IDGEKSRSVTINGGRCRDGVARSANGVVEGFFPCAGGDHLLDGVVDLAATLGIVLGQADAVLFGRERFSRSEEHRSELQSLMRISYAVFCLKKKRHKKT